MLRVEIKITGKDLADAVKAYLIAKELVNKESALEMDWHNDVDGDCEISDADDDEEAGFTVRVS